MTIEYRIKPVVRYFITRHDTQPDGSSSTQNIGTEYYRGETAYEVAYALAAAEAKRLQLPIDSMELIYPQTPIEYELRPNPVYGVDEIVFRSRSPSPHTREDVAYY